MKKLAILLLLTAHLPARSQSSGLPLAGVYADNITKLELKADSTFYLKSIDDVFPYTYKSYENTGRWAVSGNRIILNPGKIKRTPIVSLRESKMTGTASVTIKINYQLEIYDNDVLVNREPAKFEMLTLYLNKPKKYHHLLHTPAMRICAFSPKVRHQLIVDSTNTIILPRQQVALLGVYTYGFDKFVELLPASPDANFFEITVIMPVDKDRTPRSKEVLVRHNRAYFYEYQGKLVTSGLLMPLDRITD